MRIVSIVLTAVFLAAVPALAEDSAAGAMKELFMEMKAHAEAEKAFRESKKKEVQALETQIDAMRAGAPPSEMPKDPAGVKPLQVKRLAILEEVARHDVQASEESVKFAQRKLEISKQNLAAFQKKKAEAEKSIA